MLRHPSPWQSFTLEGCSHPGAREAAAFMSHLGRPGPRPGKGCKSSCDDTCRCDLAAAVEAAWQGLAHVNKALIYLKQAARCCAILWVLRSSAMYIRT